MIVGCYHLQLYCENYNGEDGTHAWREFPHEYTHELGSTCRANARKDGWKLSDNKAYCPKCVKLGAVKPKEGKQFSTGDVSCALLRG